MRACTIEGWRQLWPGGPTDPVPGLRDDLSRPRVDDADGRFALVGEIDESLVLPQRGALGTAG